MSRHWAIVGGGLMGLSLGWQLARQGHQVTIYESAPQPGGLASAWQLDGFTWDRFYHVVLPSDVHLREILRGIGLDHELEWFAPRSAVYQGGLLHPMTTALEFLRYPGLGLLDKFRLASTLWRAGRRTEPAELADLPVEDWLRRQSGGRAFERFWQPLLLSKLGPDYRRTAASFIWATARRLYAARSAGMGPQKFGVVPGGYARILERLGAALENQGVNLRCAARVQRVQRDAGRWQVVCGDEPASYDQVVVTVPTPLAAELCGGLGTAERRSLAELRYIGVVCASLVLARPLSPHYITNLADPGLPFTAVVEMTALLPASRLGGRHLVYLPRYAPSDDPVLGLGEDRLRADWWPALQRMHPGLEDKDLLGFHVARARHVFPLPLCGYRHLAPPLRTSQPGLFLVNSAQILHGTLNVNETVGRAFTAAEELSRV